MVDLDSNPTKLIEIVETGKQMLMTRGSLTTFSLASIATRPSKNLILMRRCSVVLHCCWSMNSPTPTPRAAVITSAGKMSANYSTRASTCSYASTW